jgi:hypothetical protein
MPTLQARGPEFKTPVLSKKLIGDLMNSKECFLFQFYVCVLHTHYVKYISYCKLQFKKHKTHNIHTPN